MALLQKVNFIVNWGKLLLTPSQNILFLGLCWDTTLETVGVDEGKRDKLSRRASKILHSKSVT